MMVLFGACCLFLYGLVFTWSRIRILNLRYEFTRLTEQHREVTDQNKKLTIELATYTSLKQVEQVARDKFGMVKPPKKNVIVIQ